jgi:DNA-binding CsgD family transcriptional regulator
MALSFVGWLVTLLVAVALGVGTVTASPSGQCNALRVPVAFPQHADEHRPKRPILLVDDPVRADPLVVGDHEEEGVRLPGLMPTPTVRLTRREREVLRLAAQGYTFREIAQRLGIRDETVETHLLNAMRKMRGDPPNGGGAGVREPRGAPPSGGPT